MVIKNKIFTRSLNKIILLLLVILFISLSDAYTQSKKEEPPPFKERLFFGGSFGLQFGTITDIEISPIVGFWVLPRVAVATGPNYRFYKAFSERTDIYGGRAYIEFVVIKDINSLIPIGMHTGIFLHAENELLSLQSSFWKTSAYTSKRFFVNTILAGAGISQQMGRRSSLNMMVLWALNESVYNIYGNPVFKFSFTF